MLGVVKLANWRSPVMSEPHRSYDLLIIGGGLAGATLGRSMTLAGAQVLIIEKETEFRDRIRGEVLLPWGSVEAKELGIYDVLLQSCAREAPRELFFLEGEPTSPRDFLTSTPQTDMRAFLLSSRHAGGVARRCGEIWRGGLARGRNAGSLSR
jgi:2-polyprenyl-6-methoxyphenol hydroxylase-like FAD-dependent oxidoreductase